ncbi:hypothetical protein V5F31_06005 [Xanthobacter sp. V7C-4]|uniref:hypothetical protein n=1 Tax=Xanthobacter autotrophicus (strain ATCC BAA-1158 / Py2) TaxID=78245 RepID=UPI003729DDBF
MSRGPATFRQRDMTAAVKAVTAAGLDIARIELDKSGKIVIIPGRREEPAREGQGGEEPLEVNEWDHG